MTTRDILIQARDKAVRDHISGFPCARYQLAVDLQGNRVQPHQHTAAYWSSIGAVIAVEPVDNGHFWPDTTFNGHEAIDYLEEAAKRLGYQSPNEVDRLAPSQVGDMFDKALWLAGGEEPQRRTGSKGTGGHPKGLAA